MFSFCLKNPSDDDDNFAVEFQTEIATENCGYNFCSPETATHPPLNIACELIEQLSALMI